MIIPYFSVLSLIVPKMKILIDNCKDNCEKYKEMVDECEALMIAGNSKFWYFIIF